MEQPIRLKVRGSRDASKVPRATTKVHYMMNDWLASLHFFEFLGNLNKISNSSYIFSSWSIFISSIYLHYFLSPYIRIDTDQTFAALLSQSFQKKKRNLRSGVLIDIRRKMTSLNISNNTSNFLVRKIKHIQEQV